MIKGESENFSFFQFYNKVHYFITLIYIPCQAKIWILSIIVSIFVLF